MSLQLGPALTDGIKRGTTKTGGLLLAGLFVIQLLTQVFANTVAADALPAESEFAVGLTLPLPGTVAGALTLVMLLMSAAYFVVMSRALARPRHAMASVPPELYTRRMGRATLSVAVAGIIVTVLTAIGLLFFIIPGIVLASCFLFFIFAIGVEDRGVIGALKRSWGLSKGNRLKLALVVILAGAIGVAVGLVGTVFELIGLPAVADVASAAITSVLYVFLYAIIAAAYLELRDGEAGGSSGSGSADTLGTVAD